MHLLRSLKMKRVSDVEILYGFLIHSTEVFSTPTSFISLIGSVELNTFRYSYVIMTIL